jgi:RNA polymerase sigma factor (sigma-70 family)
MNERHQDCELLRKFVRQGDQPAFAAVVRRHLDLVYATALRKLEDPGAAEEVAQNVFAALARKAWQFAPDDSLPAWLHRTTLLESKTWLRGELRRRRREHAAAELGTTMKTPDQQPALRALVPLLDEALLSLREKERTVLLLRYYESQSLRDVGASLGVSEDAARKRVGAALDSLSSFFQRRGFKTATTAATAAALQQTAAAAPATVAASISQTAMQAVTPSFAGVATLLSRWAGLTKLQTTALCLVLAAAPVSWQWHQTQLARKEAATAQLTVETTRTQQEKLALEVARLRAESTRLDGALSRATEARARDNEPARKEDTLKARLFALLTAADYHWPEDLDFVRIPKSAVKELNPLRSVNLAGKIQDWGAELLGLTPEEKQRLEDTLRVQSEALSQLAATQACETNYLPAALATHWAGNPYKSVWVPPLGAETQPLMANLLAQVSDALGDERAQLLLGDAVAGKSTFSSTWGVTFGDLSKGELLTVCVNPDASDGLEYGTYRYAGGGGGVSKNRHEVRLGSIPAAITSRFFDPWLAQMGITNTAARANP